MSQFTAFSQQMNKEISKNDRKKQGIYFTPKKARDRLFEILDKLKLSPKTILEPSFGSGEFLEDLNRNYPDSRIQAVEKNEILFDGYVENTDIDADYINEDFLQYKGEKTDLIVGNPPYFVTKLKNKECMSGRGNIFVLFLYKCLKEHLQDGGVLAFVLSTSLYNCSYYERCRRYISENTTILHVENLDANYFGTSQDTMLLVLRKGKPENDNFLFYRGGNVYISPYYKELRKLVKNSTTLSVLGFNAKTGSVTWNENKSKLTDNPKSGNLLIYSSNIKEGKLVLGGLGGLKKQYINIDKELVRGPAILVARGYGNSYKFEYLVIKEEMKFYGENHVNVITPEGNLCKDTMEMIETSFGSEKTQEFIKYFIGNGSLSRTELVDIFPIFN